MVKRSGTKVAKRFDAFAKKSHTVKLSKEMGGKRGSAFERGAASTNPSRPDPAGGKKGSQFRTRATINRLNMYVAKPDRKAMKARPTDPHAGRINPDRKWFGNVRTVDQKELDKYRRTLEDSTQKKTGSGFAVQLKQKKIPLSLVKDAMQKTLSDGERLLQVTGFGETFGPKKQRKRPVMAAANLEDMMQGVETKHDGYDEAKDKDLHKNDFVDMKDAIRHAIFDKGLSRRIWEELYKVIDSSDVVIYVLDARNPEGTRTHSLEEHIKRNCPNKHFVFVLNKCDLVPTSVTQKWVKYLQQFHPTIAFQASINTSFGKGSLIQLLKQFDLLHRDKKSISVGFVGYPNVGKSACLNTLMKKAAVRSSPVPGETKVWQYVTLTKRIHLIDCPGIVYDAGETEVDKVLKGVVRAEKLPDPETYVAAILEKTERKHIIDCYSIPHWDDAEDFIEQLGIKTGKLLKHGAIDSNNVCRTVIFDWQRGKIPYFEKPPKVDCNAVQHTVQQLLEMMPIDKEVLKQLNENGEEDAVMVETKLEQKQKARKAAKLEAKLTATIK